MAMFPVTDVATVKAVVMVAAVLVTATTVLNKAGKTWQREFVAPPPTEAALEELVEGVGVASGEGLAGSGVALPAGGLVDSNQLSRSDAPRVALRPTTVNLEPFNQNEPADALPRVIDKYIGHVHNPSRLIDRLERLAKGDESLRKESPRLHAGTVFARQLDGESNLMEIRVPLRQALNEAGDLMLDIEQSPGQRHAMVISPSDASSETELRFSVHKRHLPGPGMSLRVFGMGSQMPLLVKGEVEIE